MIHIVSPTIIEENLKEEFSTFDIIRILDILRERLQVWMNRGFISPSIQVAKGKGSKNIFSRWDLYGIALFYKVTQSGVNRKEARNIFNLWYRSTKTVPIEERYIYIFASVTYLRPSNKSVLDRSRRYIRKIISTVSRASGHM